MELLVYVLVTIRLTVWLATTLFRNGALFLDDVCDDNPAMTKAVNHLLVVGFYMLNLGWAFLILRSDRPADAVQAVEVLASKLGLLLVTLGLIHSANLWVFQRIRRGRRGETIPTIQPTMSAGPFPGGSPTTPAFATTAPPPGVHWDGERWAGRPIAAEPPR